MRGESEARKDLDHWETVLDRHLAHCETCDEGRERYCREGMELSVMVTRLLMEKMREQVKRTDGLDASVEPSSQDAEEKDSSPIGNERHW